MSDATDIKAQMHAAKLARRDALTRMVGGEPSYDVDAYAEQDLTTATNIGLVLRELPPEAASQWREAITRLAEQAGQQMDTGVTKTGVAWAGVRNEPADTTP